MESERGCSIEGNSSVFISNAPQEPREHLTLSSRVRAALALLAIGGGILACTPHERPPEKDQGGISIPNDEGDADGQGEEGEGGGDFEEGSEEVPSLLDLSQDQDLPPTPKGCEVINFVFVVDNSDSMWDHQVNLANSFPEFIEAIDEAVTQEGVKVDRYKMAVVKTDDSWNPECDWKCNQEDAVCELGEVNVCNYPQKECHGNLGAFLTWPYEKLQPCLKEGGPRFIDSNTYPFDEQKAIFSCLQPGVHGSQFELQIDSLHASLLQNGPFECNKGFFDQNGPTVITMITNEDDLNSISPQELVVSNIVNQAGGGKGENVVMLGLLPKANCQINLFAPNLEEFFNKVAQVGGHVVIDSVCDEDYAPFFQKEAADAVREACLNYQAEE